MKDKLEHIKKIVEESVVSRQSAVSETRYPYTYSADFLRTHTDIIPKKYLEEQAYVDGFLSRAQAAGIKTSWAKDLDVDGEDLACVFADAYIKENNYFWEKK